MPVSRLASALLSLMLLAGCELLGIESPEKLAALKEGEGKAVGSACRHALRAIEDCYAMNPKAAKAAVFSGWREMDEYMRENKIEGVAPTLVRTNGKLGLVAKARTESPPDAKATSSLASADTTAH